MNAETNKNIFPPEASGDHLSRYFEAIVESSDDAIVSKDLNGIIRSWNPAATKIFGYTGPEIIGRSVTVLIPQDHHDEEPEILARLRRGEKIDHYETTRQRKDGSRINVSLTVSPIKNAEGVVIGASKIARDITAQKRAEEAVLATRQELARLNAELEERVRQRTESLNNAVAQMEEFSYSVSHDLRNPARAMQGYATALLEDYGARLDDTAREYIHKIIRSGARMDKLIVDLLTYSKVARDKIEVCPVKLHALIQDVIQQYPEMQAPHATIIIEGPIPDVMAHEPSMMQVISNLLSNAVKFVAPGTLPSITIRAEQKALNVRLWIQDNGIGIPPEFHKRVFEVFERGHQDRRYEGTGIGLAIVRKSVERVGGKVGVQANSEVGSSFWIEVPAAPA